MMLMSFMLALQSSDWYVCIVSNFVGIVIWVYGNASAAVFSSKRHFLKAIATCNLPDQGMQVVSIS